MTISVCHNNLVRVRITHVQLAIRSMMNAVVKSGRCSKKDLELMRIEDQLGKLHFMHNTQVIIAN